MSDFPSVLFGFLAGFFFLAFLIVIVAVRWSGKGGKGEKEHKFSITTTESSRAIFCFVTRRE